MTTVLREDDLELTVEPLDGEATSTITSSAGDIVLWGRRTLTTRPACPAPGDHDHRSIRSLLWEAFHRSAAGRW